MSHNFKTLYLVSTPTHVGSGDELGIIDMPIQREKTTNFPKYEASSIKGCIRREFDENKAKELFGGEGEKGEQCQPGQVIISDAKTLLFPVKSTDEELFYWVTCPYVLKRYAEDCSMYGSEADIKNITENIVHIEESSTEDYNIKKTIILEEFKYELKTSKIPYISKLLKNLENTNEYLKEKLKKNILIIPDDDFKYFVEMSTEVNTRIKVDDKGISENLFTIEYLPIHTILYGFIKGVGAGEVNEKINGKYLQIGGDESLGKGINKIIMEADELCIPV